MKKLLTSLNILFHFVHVSVILLFLTGWIFSSTRPAHLALLLITAFSWYVLGRFFGPGYCFLREWHWSVKRMLGENELPESYITLLVNIFTADKFDPELIDGVTEKLFIFISVASVVLNLYDLMSYYLVI